MREPAGSQLSNYSKGGVIFGGKAGSYLQALVSGTQVSREFG